VYSVVGFDSVEDFALMDASNELDFSNFAMQNKMRIRLLLRIHDAYLRHAKKEKEEGSGGEGTTQMRAPDFEKSASCLLMDNIQD